MSGVGRERWEEFVRARLLSARLAPLHGSHRRSLCFNTREAAVMFRDDFARSGAVELLL